MAFTMISYSKPAWANAAQTAIDAQVVFKELGTAPIPFTASKNDIETHGAEVFNAIVDAAATVPIAAYAPPQISLADQATAAMFATVGLTSGSDSNLDGTYPIDAQTQSDLQAEVLAFDTNGQFLDGQTSIQWPDASKVLHTFTAAQFKAFTTAVGSYVGLLKAIRRTNALPPGMTTFPPATISIA